MVPESARSRASAHCAASYLYVWTRRLWTGSEKATLVQNLNQGSVGGESRGAEEQRLPLSSRCASNLIPATPRAWEIVRCVEHGARAVPVFLLAPDAQRQHPAHTLLSTHPCIDSDLAVFGWMHWENYMGAPDRGGRQRWHPPTAVPESLTQSSSRYNKHPARSPTPVPFPLLSPHPHTQPHVLYQTRLFSHLRSFKQQRPVALVLPKSLRQPPIKRTYSSST